MDDKAMEVSFVVDGMFIPLSEMIVGSLVGRVVEIERSRINRKFIKTIRIEMSRLQNRIIGLRKKLKGLLDDVAIATGRQPSVANVNRNRPNPLLSLGFDFSRLKRCDWAMTKIVVEFFKCSVGERLRIYCCGLVHVDSAKHGFDRPADEKRIEHEVRRTPENQVGVLTLVAGEQVLEDDRESGGRLNRILEDVTGCLKLIEPLAK